MNIGEKIAAIVVSEILETLFFVIIIILFSSLGSLSPLVEQLSNSIVSGLVTAWIMLGIATPFVIGLEIWNAFGSGAVRSLGV